MSPNQRARCWVTVGAAAMAAASSAALAQFPPPPPVLDRWPEAKSPQTERPQTPAASPAPTRAPAPAQADSNRTPPPLPALAKKPVPATAVACGGVFAKESSHIKLAMKYDSRNITYGQVDGPEGSKIPASILFPNDPRRRLEVIWAQEAARSGTSVIAINGKSQWSAPKGMKLGLSLAALEKANGRPFKISGFDSQGSAAVNGWEGGALGNIPGGCKMGMRLIADSKTAEARSGEADKEHLSNDEALRALKPTVVEILIGY